jgi:hypothetical protein
MNTVKAFGKEIGIASVLGIGLVFSKQWKGKEVQHPCLHSTAELKTSELAPVVVHLEALGCEAEFAELVRECDELLTLTKGKSTRPGFQFYANRKLVAIEALCTTMCERAKSSADCDRIDAAIRCIDDHLPQLMQMCNTYLQHMLM